MSDDLSYIKISSVVETYKFITLNNMYRTQLIDT